MKNLKIVLARATGYMKASLGNLLAFTMEMFQELIMWMSLIRYCHDRRLLMSTFIVCHIA